MPEELRLLAARQYGLAGTGQALQWLTPAALRRLRAQGVLAPFGRNVLRFAGAPGSWRQRAMGACLAYGPPVALSHLAAARLLGWTGRHGPAIEVVVPPYRSGRRQGVKTHRAELPAADVVGRLGLPVTSSARTLVDVAGRLPFVALGDFYDHLMQTEGLRATEVMARIPGAAACPGHPLHRLHGLSGLRLDRPTTSDSLWEDRVADWLVGAGMPLPVRQHQVVVAETVWLLDLAYPDQKVAVEFDGWTWHRSRQKFDEDRARTTELALAGWLVVLVTSAHGQAMTVRRVQDALVQRGWSPAEQPSTR